MLKGWGGGGVSEVLAWSTLPTPVSPVFTRRNCCTKHLDHQVLIPLLLFCDISPLSLLRRSISNSLTFLSDEVSLALMTVEREKESDRSYLNSASHPHHRVCGNRWYMSVMWLGSRGPGGGVEERKNTQTVDVATVCILDCVQLQICL